MQDQEKHQQKPQQQNHKHGVPPDGMECLCTMEDITEENYVEYQSYPSLKWSPALYEQSVVEELLKTQFHDYVQRLGTSNCQAELRRMLGKGPPIYIEDVNALPLPDGDEYICQLYYSSDGQERSAMLDGAVQGDERQALWDELKRFIVVEGKEEGDDDDDEENGYVNNDNNKR
ncbi:hypothetical protein MPSEU_000691600 [Mayamaea pseudoterrestris]|nr:hypothetical protein MPSEU_000691600 [Mayamaea pseudoterrestris]